MTGAPTVVDQDGQDGQDGLPTPSLRPAVALTSPRPLLWETKDTAGRVGLARPPREEPT